MNLEKPTERIFMIDGTKTAGIIVSVKILIGGG